MHTNQVRRKVYQVFSTFFHRTLDSIPTILLLQFWLGIYIRLVLNRINGSLKINVETKKNLHVQVQKGGITKLSSKLWSTVSILRPYSPDHYQSNIYNHHHHQRYITEQHLAIPNKYYYTEQFWNHYHQRYITEQYFAIPNNFLVLWLNLCKTR